MTSAAKIVPSSDKSRALTNAITGAAFDPTTGAVTHQLILRGMTLDAVPLTFIARPAMPPNGWQGTGAMSARWRELAFFGELDVKGAPASYVRTYDFTTNQTAYKPIVGTTRFGAPLAATYEPGADAYYVLDRSVDANGGTVLRLLRVTRSARIDVLAQFAPATDAWNYAMTTGSDGGLVLSSWGSLMSHLVVIGVNGTQLKLRAQSGWQAALATAATVSSDGLVIVIVHADSGPRAVRIDSAWITPKIVTGADLVRALHGRGRERGGCDERCIRGGGDGGHSSTDGRARRQRPRRRHLGGGRSGRRERRIRSVHGRLASARRVPGGVQLHRA